MYEHGIRYHTAQKHFVQYKVEEEILDFVSVEFGQVVKVLMIIAIGIFIGVIICLAELLWSYPEKIKKCVPKKRLRTTLLRKSLQLCSYEH